MIFIFQILHYGKFHGDDFCFVFLLEKKKKKKKKKQRKKTIPSCLRVMLHRKIQTKNDIEIILKQNFIQKDSGNPEELS